MSTLDKYYLSHGTAALLLNLFIYYYLLLTVCLFVCLFVFVFLYINRAFRIEVVDYFCRSRSRGRKN